MTQVGAYTEWPKTLILNSKTNTSYLKILPIYGPNDFNYFFLI